MIFSLLDDLFGLWTLLGVWSGEWELWTLNFWKIEKKEIRKRKVEYSSWIGLWDLDWTFSFELG